LAVIPNDQCADSRHFHVSGGHKGIMNNVTFGILALIYASLFYYWSWRYQQRHRYKTAILLMIAGAVGLYGYVIADFFLHYWDERYHALVAKNLLKHPFIPTLYDNPVLPYDFREWSANHIWVHKQPLPLWGMAAGMWVFGIHEIALRIPSVILVSVSIYLVFAIGSYLFNKRIGYFSAFLFSINGLVISLMSGRRTTDHIDIFFMFFVLLAIFLSVQYCRKQNRYFAPLIGMSIGLAILSKWLPALIVLPIWLLLVLDTSHCNRKEVAVGLCIIIATLSVVFLPWQFYIFETFPKEAGWESKYNFRHLTEVIEGHSGSVFFYLNRIRINYGELIYLPLGWFFYRTYRQMSNKKRLAVLVWFMVPFAFFSMATTKMQGYLLFAAPTLFYMTAEFFYTLADSGNHRKWRWLRITIMAALIILPIRYTLERLEVFEVRDRNPQWVADLRALHESGADQRAVLFNYQNPIEAMFYTDLTVYPHIPDKTTITKLIDQDYRVLVNDDGELSQEVMAMNDITLLNLATRVED
jgi:4-amino-4-deoxy-L-arabinose transferase-like glycosyltransferase